MEQLTPREREIAALVADGLSDAQIAARLGLTGRTVKNDLSIAYRFLRLREAGNRRVSLAIMWERARDKGEG